MDITTEIILERERGDVLVRVAGNVQKHFGRLEVSDFQSDVELTRDEQEQAEDAICDKLRHQAIYLPEMEPDARHYSR